MTAKTAMLSVRFRLQAETFLRRTDSPKTDPMARRRTRQAMSLTSLVAALLTLLGALLHPAHAAGNGPAKFKSICVQYIAALGAPGANSGDGAQLWGLWPLAPGPRGVWLASYEQLRAAGGAAAQGWHFDDQNLPFARRCIERHEWRECRELSGTIPASLAALLVSRPRLFQTIVWHSRRPWRSNTVEYSLSSCLAGRTQQHPRS